MTHDPRPDELDALLSAAEEPIHDRLAALLSQAPQRFVERPSPEAAESHLAAILGMAEQHAHVGPPVPGRVEVWRRRLGHLAGMTAAKVALGVGVAAAATGGMAATGTLPDAVQRVVADGAARIGIQLPTPADRSVDPGATDDAPVVEPSVAPPATMAPERRQPAVTTPRPVEIPSHEATVPPPTTGPPADASPAARPSSAPGQDASQVAPSTPPAPPSPRTTTPPAVAPPPPASPPPASPEPREAPAPAAPSPSPATQPAVPPAPPR